MSHFDSVFANGFESRLRYLERPSNLLGFSHPLPIGRRTDGCRTADSPVIPPLSKRAGVLVSECVECSVTAIAAMKNGLDDNAFGAIASQTNSAYQPQQTYMGLRYHDSRWYFPHTNKILSDDLIDSLVGDTNL